MMKKTLLVLLFYLYRLMIELMYFLGYPVLWLVLGWKNYRGAMRVSDTEVEILIHASSLGEVNALQSLIQQLKSRGHKLAVNTITVTGRERIASLFPDIPVCLAPLDVPHLRARQMRKVKPKLILIAETEIWPSMLYAASWLSIPVVFINARISPRTLNSFKLITPLLNFVASSVTRVLAQSGTDAQRFNELFPGKAEFTGNLKFALELPMYDAAQIRAEWGYGSEDLILCWGSSRPGEEELILKAFQTLKKQYKHLKLIIAPRHPKRVKEIESLLSDTNYTLLSTMQSNAEILVIDGLGILTKCYAVCSLAIIGGSFYDFGGHNPLEAAFYAKPVIIGNYHASCRDSVNILQQQRGILVSSKETLTEDIKLLLDDSELSAAMGKSARLVLTENASALQNHIREIEKCLS